MDDHPSDPSGPVVPVKAPVVPGDAQEACLELSRILLDQPLGQFLHRVAELAQTTLPGVDGLSVTLVENGTARSAAFTSEVAALLDERQYETGFGPCLAAAESGDVVRVDVGADTGAYEAFVRAARRQGVTAVASVGMPVPHRVVGALNLYSTTGPLDEDTVLLARTFASYAAVALANAALYGSAAQLATQLEEAMRSRAVIEQAKGIVMARHHLDADAAFTHLARASQETNTKLRDLAQRIVQDATTG